MEVQHAAKVVRTCCSIATGTVHCRHTEGCKIKKRVSNTISYTKAMCVPNQSDSINQLDTKNNINKKKAITRIKTIPFGGL